MRNGRSFDYCMFISLWSFRDDRVKLFLHFGLLGILLNDMLYLSVLGRRFHVFASLSQGGWLLNFTGGCQLLSSPSAFGADWVRFISVFVSRRSLLHHLKARGRVIHFINFLLGCLDLRKLLWLTISLGGSIQVTDLIFIFLDEKHLFANLSILLFRLLLMGNYSDVVCLLLYHHC